MKKYATKFVLCKLLQSYSKLSNFHICLYRQIIIGVKHNHTTKRFSLKVTHSFKKRQLLRISACIAKYVITE